VETFAPSRPRETTSHAHNALKQPPRHAVARLPDGGVLAEQSNANIEKGNRRGLRLNGGARVHA
jgi:hypothetical protein